MIFFLYVNIAVYVLLYKFLCSNIINIALYISNQVDWEYRSSD